jgi:hypothetical protein
LFLKELWVAQDSPSAEFTGFASMHTPAKNEYSMRRQTTGAWRFQQQGLQATPPLCGY